MKTCGLCGVAKNESDYWRATRRKDGLQSYCKSCHIIRYKKWIQDNPEKHLAAVKRRSAKWRAAKPDAYRASRQRRFRRWREKNPEHCRRRLHEWAKSNREKINARKRERYRTDIAYRLEVFLRNTLRVAVKLNRRQAGAKQLLGCSLDSFKLYIESKFEPGMTWDNHGEWHLDHIMPLAIFDLTKPEHQKRAFHFSNMQPLWAADNMTKSATPPAKHQFQLL